MREAKGCSKRGSGPMAGFSESVTGLLYPSLWGFPVQANLEREISRIAAEDDDQAPDVRRRSDLEAGARKD